MYASGLTGCGQIFYVMRRQLVIVLGISLGLVFASVIILMRSRDACNVRLADVCYRGSFARTAKQRERGLSGRESLPANQALVFIFEGSSKHCFWMKDMRFPIDIIWLDEQKRVVHIEANVSPDTYPKSFCPPSNAKYVVEVNAHQASENQISLGDTALF